MPGFKGLAVPGPSNMPFRIRQAMDVALEDHRAPDFPQFTQPLFGDLKKVFQTKSGQVFFFRVLVLAAGSRLSLTRYRRATRC